MVHKGAVHVWETSDMTMALYRLDTDEGVPVHAHDYPHDLFVVKGKVRVLLGPINPEAKEGDKVAFPTGASHGFVALEPSEVVCTHKTADLMRGESWQQS